MGLESFTSQALFTSLSDELEGTKRRKRTGIVAWSGVWICPRMRPLDIEDNLIARDCELLGTSFKDVVYEKLALTNDPSGKELHLNNSAL